MVVERSAQSIPTYKSNILAVSCSVSFKFYQLVKYLTNFFCWQYTIFQWSFEVIRIQDPYVSLTIELNFYIPFYYFSKMFMLCICIFESQYKYYLRAQPILAETQKFKFFFCCCSNNFKTWEFWNISPSEFLKFPNFSIKITHRLKRHQLHGY